MLDLILSRRGVLALALFGCGPTSEIGDDASDTESSEGSGASASGSTTGSSTGSSTGDPSSESTSTPTECAWGYTPWIVDSDRREARGVSAWSGGLILGTAISDGDVLSVDPSGAIVWTHDFEPTADSVNVIEALATADGGAIV